MARRYYRRRTVVVRPKKRWATNIKGINPAAFDVSPNTANGFAINLVENSVASSAPTPTVLKCGNFKIQGDVTLLNATSQPGEVTLALYVMFVPQGINVTNGIEIENLIGSHPEWILSWKLADIGSLSSGAQNGFTFSSRLKRNLQSGDRVALLAVARTDLTLQSPQKLKVNGMCQYWTTTA